MPRKRKAPRISEENAATLDGFKEASRPMATDLMAYKAEMSKDAAMPNTMAPGTVMPAPTRAQLAVVARMRGLSGGSPPSTPCELLLLEPGALPLHIPVQRPEYGDGLWLPESELKVTQR
jgi:hypothetical protein